MFTLVKDTKQGVNVLCKDGKPCFCPYQTKIAVPVPHRIDPRQMEMQIQQFNCNSACLFFFEEEEKEEGEAAKKVVFTGCTGCRFDIEEVESKFQIIK